jgi:hypothetical protein
VVAPRDGEVAPDDAHDDARIGDEGVISPERDASEDSPSVIVIQHDAPLPSPGVIIGSA